jgi:hypothetical protein
VLGIRNIPILPDGEEDYGSGQRGGMGIVEDRCPPGAIICNSNNNETTADLCTLAAAPPPARL